MVDWETRTQTPVVDVTGHSDMGIPIPTSLAFWASPVNVKFCAMGGWTPLSIQATLYVIVAVTFTNVSCLRSLLSLLNGRPRLMCS